MFRAGVLDPEGSFKEGKGNFGAGCRSCPKPGGHFMGGKADEFRGSMRLDAHVSPVDEAGGGAGLLQCAGNRTQVGLRAGFQSGFVATPPAQGDVKGGSA